MPGDAEICGFVNLGKKWVIFESVVAWVFVGEFDKSGDIGFWSVDGWFGG